MTSTLYFFVVWLMAPVLWDLYLLGRYGPDATISRRLLVWAHEFPLLPLMIAFALGIIIGHLFVPQRQ